MQLEQTVVYKTHPILLLLNCVSYEVIILIPYDMVYSLSCRAHWNFFTSFQGWIKVRDPSNGKAKLWMTGCIVVSF